MMIFGFTVPPLGDIGQFLIGAAAIYGAWQAWEAKRAAKEANRTAAAVATDLVQVKHNTNSMTGEIARLAKKEGAAEEGLRGEAVNKQMAEARAEGHRLGQDSNPAKAPLAVKTEEPVEVIDNEALIVAERGVLATEKLANIAGQEAERAKSEADKAEHEAVRAKSEADKASEATKK